MKSTILLRSIYLVCLLLTSYVSKATIIISTPTTWSSSQFINDDIWIVPGGSLTLNNGAVFTMASGTHIKVITSTTQGVIGGRLYITNATITGANWHGIFVCGDKTLSQQNNRMARAILNSATIQSSQWGITNWDLIQDWLGNYSGGGIIQATNSTFHNNGYAVYMRHYQNFNNLNSSVKMNDYSSFNKCTFIQDNNAQQPATGGFARLHEVEGVRFSGCSFSINLGSSSKYLNRIGIHLESAGAIVDEYCNVPVMWGQNCTNSTQTTFNNLNYGVYAAAPFNTHSVRVNKSLFNDCRFAISVYGTQNAQIRQNRIEIYPDFTNKHSGIALEASTGFQVEENDININSGGNASLAYGIEVTNSGENSNQLYKNSVSNAHYAVQANGLNRSSSVWTGGLKFLCNEMANSFNSNYDIVVTGGVGVGTLQGTYSNFGAISAGNVFATYLCNDFNNFKNEGLPLTYFYDPSEPASLPQCVSGTVSVQQGDPKNCPSNISSPLVAQITYSTFLNAKIQIETSIDAGAAGNELIGLMDDYRLLYNRMIQTYLGYYDSLGQIRYDSVLYVLGTARYLYEYQVMKAGIEAQMGDYDVALTTLSAMNTNYRLTREQRIRVNNIEDMIYAAMSLSSVDNDWDLMTDWQKMMIYDMTTEDDYFAGYMSRYYLSVYEDSLFSPNLLHQDSSGQWFPLPRKIKIEPEYEVSLYPNPVDHSFQITGVTSGELQVLDLTGRTLMVQKVIGGVAIDVSALPGGVYITRVKDENGKVHILKFNKQ